MASGFKTGYTKPIKNHTSSFSTVDRLVDDQKRLLLAWTAINFSSDQATNCKGPWQSTQQFTEFHEWQSKPIRFMSNEQRKKNLLTLTLGLILKRFSFSSNLTKKVPNNYSEHFPPKKKMLRRVTWHRFWEIWAKVKSEKRSEIKPPLETFDSRYFLAIKPIRKKILKLFNWEWIVCKQCRLSPFTFLPYLFGFQRTYDPHFYSSWVILLARSKCTYSPSE